MKPSLILPLLVVSSFLHARFVHVAPGAPASGSGTKSSPLDVVKALEAAKPGDTIDLAEGVYRIPYSTGRANTIRCTTPATAESPIVVQAPLAKRAVLDFQFAKDDWVQDGFGISVSGDWWTFRRIDVTRAGYQGAYVTGAHNTFDHCSFFENRNTGLEINKGGAYTTVRNCDAYRNFDPKKGGSMADGFGPKQTQGPGNKFIGCRAWENSDDGFDLFDSPQMVTLDSCWAFRNGIDVMGWGSIGNQNGFKVGGNGAAGNHVLRHCVAFGNPVKGFDQNNNTGAVTMIHCTAYMNGAYNFAFGQSPTSGRNILRNCVSHQGKVDVGTSTQEKNSWNLSLVLGSVDFASLDTSIAHAERSVDGSLPSNSLLRPSAGSELLDRGAKLEWSYLGSAPDLGAFEFMNTTEVMRWEGIPGSVPRSMLSFGEANVRLRDPIGRFVAGGAGVRYQAGH